MWRGQLEDDVSALKAGPGEEIGVTGEQHLRRPQPDRRRPVDEYRLFVYPVVLGRGARLFETATSMPKLKLMDCRPFRSGVVLISYSTPS